MVKALEGAKGGEKLIPFEVCLGLKQKREKVVNGFDCGNGDGVGGQLQRVDDFSAQQLGALAEVVKVGFRILGDVSKALEIVLDGHGNVLDFREDFAGGVGGFIEW